MRKQREIYTSPLVALVAVSKQLSLYENQRGMDSEIGDAGMKAAQFAYEDAYHEAARTLLAQWFDWVKAKSEWISRGIF